MRKSAAGSRAAFELRRRRLTGGPINAAEEGNVDGHDDDGRRFLARRSAEGLGAAQRPGGAQGLHSGLRVAGEDRRQRLRRRRQDQDRAGVGDLQRQGRTLRPRAARRLHHHRRGRGRRRRLRQGRGESVARRRPGGTLLHYDVEAHVGGKIAQLGARLIDGVAKNMADKFFANFAAIAAAGAAPAGAAEPAAAPSIAAAAPAVESPAPARAAAPAPQAIPTKTSWFRRIWEWFMSLWR